MTLNSNETTARPTEPVPTFPPIAGFWRRFAAWVVDVLLLGIAGQILGWSLSAIWFQVGPYGRLVGLCIILAYFGLMNSKTGRGQTLGKRLFHLAVRDIYNEPISRGKSFLRISILALPVILNGWALPVLQNPFFQWISAVIIFGVGASILYTMVFNGKARQGLHDLVCKTYVVHLKGTPREAFPQSHVIHRIIPGILVGLAAIVATASSLISATIIDRTALANVYGLYQILQTDDRFFTVGVNDNTLYSDRGTTHILQIQVWYKGATTESKRDQIMNDVASVVLDHVENIEEYDLLKITVTSSFDLGIASGHISYSVSETIDIWEYRLDGPRSP